MATKKKRILIAVIAAVLVIAIGAGGVVWYFSDSSIVEATKKKRKKKIIVVNNGQEAEEEENEFFDPDDWNVADVLDDYDYDDDTDNASDSDDKSSVTDKTDSKNDNESKSQYEFELDYTEPLETNQKIAFQCYHYDMDGWDNVTSQSQFDVFNYYYCSDIVTLKRIKDAGAMAWLRFKNGFGGDWTNNELSENWKDAMEQITSACKAAGLWDAVAGFHGEEHMLEMSGEQFRITTKYLRDHYPDKRIYCVLSIYEINGSAPGVNIDPMSYRTYGYVTDLGYDWYDSKDYNEHKKVVMKMMEGVGRKNVRIWLFPTTYKRFGNRSPEWCAENLQMCYDLLMDLKKEGYAIGGLDCYVWATFGGEDGLGNLLDKDMYGDEWDILRDKMREISGKIFKDSYRYTEPMN